MVREDLEDSVSDLVVMSDMKVCFIEECEFLSANAQAALRALIEKCNACSLHDDRQ